MRKESQQLSEEESIQFSGLIWVKEKSKLSAMLQPWSWR